MGGPEGGGSGRRHGQQEKGVVRDGKEHEEGLGEGVEDHGRRGWDGGQKKQRTAGGGRTAEQASGTKRVGGGGRREGASNSGRRVGGTANTCILTVHV